MRSDRRGAAIRQAEVIAVVEPGRGDMLLGVGVVPSPAVPGSAQQASQWKALPQAPFQAAPNVAATRAEAAQADRPEGPSHSPARRAVAFAARLGTFGSRRSARRSRSCTARHRCKKAARVVFKGITCPADRRRPPRARRIRARSNSAPRDRRDRGHGKATPIRDLLDVGIGILKTARTVGCGVSAVQRIKAEIA